MVKNENTNFNVFFQLLEGLMAISETEKGVVRIRVKVLSDKVRDRVRGGYS
jgi:hypothetical protein